MVKPIVKRHAVKSDDGRSAVILEIQEMNKVQDLDGFEIVPGMKRYQFDNGERINPPKDGVFTSLDGVIYRAA